MISKNNNILRKGADVIDIGGQSTKPGVQLISPQEELERIIPVIKAFRSKNNDILYVCGVSLYDLLLFSQIPISVDTLNGEVAEQAVLAGNIL